MHDDDERALLDRLLQESCLYTKSTDYFDLLQFIARLPNFAPFNAMLLHIQKPGIQYAASRHDWKTRFGAEVRENARPLIIMWPFGPVALIYDAVDVEGERIPIDARSFNAKGTITRDSVVKFYDRLAGRGIHVMEIDVGDSSAGSILPIKLPKNDDDPGSYEIEVNANHTPPVAFVTIAHELAHLYLGHLGENVKRRIKDRTRIPLPRRELEAESVAYLVAARHGVESRSQTYLANYVRDNESVDDLDVYLLTRVAGQVETLLGLASTSRFEPVD